MEHDSHDLVEEWTTVPPSIRQTFPSKQPGVTDESEVVPRTLRDRNAMISTRDIQRRKVFGFEQTI